MGRPQPGNVRGMDVAIRHRPSFAVARIALDANERSRAESGAMMATSSGVGVASSTQGGVMKGLKRSVLGGESLFVSTFIAPAAGVELDTKWGGFKNLFGGEVGFLVRASGAGFLGR